ncbi:TILB-like protein [Mya arenaria]|uniref:TILB-like protein n=1 Tax=Mya arenaria TaxID=6604 RepID=A0ABY7FTD6_MYAAR|nr:TILB-like protein [Mya arenaria]
MTATQDDIDPNLITNGVSENGRILKNILQKSPELAEDGRMLDGILVEKSERILAAQDYGVIRARIIQQQLEYKKKREIEKEEARLQEEREQREKEEQESIEGKPGFDGTWYTNINEEDKEKIAKKKTEKAEEEFKKDKEDEKNPPRPPRRMFADDGRPLNVNEAKINFTLTEDETGNNYLLDYQCYKPNKSSDRRRNRRRRTVEKLEVDESARKTVDIGNIVKEKRQEVVPPLGSKPLGRKPEEKQTSENFVDDPDVPPLE